MHFINTEESSYEIFSIKRVLDCKREMLLDVRVMLLECGFEIHMIVRSYS